MASDPVILMEYVRAAFDGLICDDFPEMEYLNVSDTERDLAQLAAQMAIESALHDRYRRDITPVESTRIMIAVAGEWQRRRGKAEEAAFDRVEGKLWAQHDGAFASDY